MNKFILLNEIAEPYDKDQNPTFVETRINPNWIACYKPSKHDSELTTIYLVSHDPTYRAEIMLIFNVKESPQKIDKMIGVVC